MTVDCRVTLEAAVRAYNVESDDEAVRIAISKTGEMLNPDLNYVEVEPASRSCPECDEDLEPAYVVAGEALVALELELSVFNVESEEHASRVARKEVGEQLGDVPLKVIEVEVIEESDESEEDATDDGPDVADGTADEATDEEANADADDGDEDDEELPDFDELMA